MSILATDRTIEATDTTQEPAPQPTSTTTGEHNSVVTTDAESPTVEQSDATRTSVTEQPTNTRISVTEQPVTTNPAPLVIPTTKPHENTESLVPAVVDEILSSQTEHTSIAQTSLALVKTMEESLLEMDTVFRGNSSSIHTQLLTNSGGGADTSAKRSISRNELVLIGVGGVCFTFFLLVTATTTAVICCLRHIKSKKKGKRSLTSSNHLANSAFFMQYAHSFNFAIFFSEGSVQMEASRERSAHVESLYADPHHFRAETSRHLDDSMILNSAYGSGLKKKPVIPSGENSGGHHSSAKYRQEFMMNINSAYAATQH